MSDQEPLQFKGAPGSPYTRKMLAYLRYRHIRYEFLVGDLSKHRGLPEPKVDLLPTFYLRADDGELNAVVDSTPLIRRFETSFPQRPTIPDHPALAFLNYLIEDYADEWLTKAMLAQSSAAKGVGPAIQMVPAIKVLPGVSSQPKVVEERSTLPGRSVVPAGAESVAALHPGSSSCGPGRCGCPNRRLRPHRFE